MQRRNFIKGTAVSAAGLLVGSSLPACGQADKAAPLTGDQTFHLNYAIHDGMFQNNAGKDFIEQIKFAHSKGFRAIEDNGMMDRPADMQEKIGSALASLGMQMGVFVMNFDHWPVKTSLTSGDKDWRDKFLKSCRDAIDVSKRCNGKLITVVPGNYANELSISYQTANVVESLKRACEILEPHGLVMVIESLSDTPDLFLRHSDQAYMICKAVGSPSCKILFDIYHMQRNEGDIIKNLDRAWDEITYIQIGDNPGRKEPTTGELNYKNIFKHIYEKGYKGILGMEHGNSLPGKEGEQRLIDAYRECDGFM
ncbi:MAG TPA: TIM barrel protein [Flavisolibacter sp.]|nr:TIM barrel protein [Flavisolibacter sp.]